MTHDSSKQVTLDSPFTAKEIGAIVSAFTGVLCCSFPDMHEYAERLLGRPIWTHQFADKAVVDALQEASRADFLRLAEWCKHDGSYPQAEAGTEGGE